MPFILKRINFYMCYGYGTHVCEHCVTFIQDGDSSLQLYSAPELAKLIEQYNYPIDREEYEHLRDHFSPAYCKYYTSEDRNLVPLAVRLQKYDQYWNIHVV